MNVISSRLLPVTLLLGTAAAQTVVLSTDFSSLPSAIDAGTAAIEPVQGFGGLGPAGGAFGGTFLRSATGNPVTITLTGLPAHDTISLDFLFAAIDSLDGTGVFPSGDFFAITIDGNTFFRESFANALPSQIQTYVSPPGVELARHVDLGFTGPRSNFTDSAYWLGGDPQFQAIGHTASTVVITMQIEGPGIQPLADESWALDNLTVRVASLGNTGSAVAYGAGCGPSMSVFGTPSTSQPLPLFVANLPPSTILTAYAIGLSDAFAGATPLPFALDFLGASNCFVLHDADISTNMTLSLQGTAGTGSLAVPNGVAGLTFFLQAWGLAPGSNPAGLVLTNGVKIVLGS